MSGMSGNVQDGRSLVFVLLKISEFVNTIYRVSESPFGPWRKPKKDGIGGRRFYAAKSMQMMMEDVFILDGRMIVQSRVTKVNGIGVEHFVFHMRWCQPKMES